MDIYQIAHEQNIAKSTMPYQWGVWCTAWARWCLELAIRNCGDHFLYCDTDSVYYYGQRDWTKYNNNAIKLSMASSAYADDPKGRRHYMGVLEEDKQMRSFKTMGAKKYAYIDDSGIHITIAGVNKRKGAAELQAWADKHGMRDGLDAMQEEFIFRDAGGTESIYNDTPILKFMLDGHEIYVPSNVAIKPSTYQISLSNDYAVILETLLDNDLFRLYKLDQQGAQLPALEIVG